MTTLLRDEIERHAAGLGLSDLVELHDKISQDREPLKKVQGIYLFGQSVDNEKAIFESAREIQERGLDAPVFVSNGPDPSDSRYKKSGFPGFSQWRDRLKEYGIEAQPIEPADKNALNTFTEAQALMRYSEGQGFFSWYVISAQFHMLRSFISSASVDIRESPSVNIFAYYGAQQDWDETVIHSQGIVTGTRKELIKGEVERIKIYTAKGDLLPAKRVLKYLAQRKN